MSIMVTGGGKWKSFDFGPDVKLDPDLPVRNVNKTMQVERPKVDLKNVVSKRTFDFYHNLTPKSAEELAVHPKKIKEVEEWLKCNVIKQQKKYSSFLLLSGPTGSGKTSTVNVLCKKMDISISEWINPMDQSSELFQRSSQINAFIEFLTESKWNSLFNTDDIKKVTLVKDFPNAVIHQPEDFLNILEECYYRTNYPIIFICTDASSSDINLSRTLFPEEIINTYNITHITFNACAPSLMKNVIKRAKSLVQENPDLFKQPSSVTVDAILASALGDIRNAMNQFYFASLIGTEDLPTTTSKTQKAGIKRKRNDKQSTLQCMTRDENLGLFHGLGRVLNPKRQERGNLWRLNCDVEKLVDEFSIQPALFVSFLFENYMKYFGDINDASRAAGILSFSERFLNNWGERCETLIFGLWISVLGLMIFNEHKVSKWTQIRGPTKISTCVHKGSEVTGLNPTDYFYYNFIKKTDTFHKFRADT